MSLVKTLSYGYRAGISVRHWIYDHLIVPEKLTVPVISIGNIVAGGSGKTPLVHYLASQIGPEKVAILSRGYRRKGKGILRVEAHMSAEECGDEPLFLAQKLPKAQVIVGKNRIETGRLMENKGLACLLLDDGMQHRKLHRDCEICVVNQVDIEQKNFLPYGPLREDPKRLKQVDLVIINGAETEELFDRAKQYIRQFSSAPIAAMNVQVLNAEEVRRKKVAVFSAIASPQRFYETLKSLGCEVIKKIEKPDHVAFAPDELKCLAQTKGIEALLCTEKDAVKLPKHFTLPLPIIPVQIALAPTFGNEHIQTIIKRFQT